MRNKTLWIVLFVLVALLIAVIILMCLRANETIAAEQFYNSLRK